LVWLFGGELRGVRRSLPEGQVSTTDWSLFDNSFCYGNGPILVDKPQAFGQNDFMRIAATAVIVLAFNSFSVSSEHSGKSQINRDESRLTGTLLKGAPRSALITFSGLWNGVNPYTNYTVLHRPIPSDYQPLMKAEPFTKPVDGADFGIRIEWDTAQTSNHGLNGSVTDHTGDAVLNDKDPNHELGRGVMFALGPCAVTFSKSIEIPSLFWTFYESSTQRVAYSGTIAVFRNISDTTPLMSVEVPYHDDKGYVWKKLTAFAGLKIAKISFDPRGQNTGLNIDDISIKLVADKE
jgi:hypothetical protein